MGVDILNSGCKFSNLVTVATTYEPKCEQMTHKNRNFFQISNINIPSGTQISNLSLNPSNFQMKVKDG